MKTREVLEISIEAITDCWLALCIEEKQITTSAISSRFSSISLIFRIDQEIASLSYVIQFSN